MSNPRILIAAPKSGSGKTLITCALLRALTLRGMKVLAFKCGPDYIDPMFHHKVLGIPSRNLDLYFTGEDETRALFLKDNDGDVSVIEGVMGLFDGLAGTQEEASSYHLAKALKTPIILVVNARGMGRSVLAEIAGFLSMDDAKLIKGVILNQVGEAFFESIAPMIEEKLGIKALGYFPTKKDLELQSRYLGLKLPGEIKELSERVSTAAGILEETVCIEEVLRLARSARGDELFYGEYPWLSEDWIAAGRAGKPEAANAPAGRAAGGGSVKKTKIAVAMDEAFCFYYEDNLRLLRNAGAEIIPFSPIHDKKLPEGVSGILLGGGYPELVAKELSENESMRESIKNAIRSGMPSLAECGGFMYLHDAICTAEGELFPMAGVIRGICSDAKKLVRFGYAEFLLPDGKRIRGHEFHYYDSDACGTDLKAVKPVTGRSWSCGYDADDHTWCFGHFYYPSDPEFARCFADRCRNWKS